MREKPLMPPLAWVAVFALGMILAAWSFPETRADFPGRAFAAYALVGAGFAVAVLGVIAFRQHGTTVDPTRPGRASALVTTGVFGITRNPMYVGMALAVAGIGLRTGSLIALSLVPVFVLALTKFQIEPEEVAMRRLFGTAWDDYAARVPRWVLR